MNNTQKRVGAVLIRLIEIANTSPDDAEILSEELEDMLNDLLHDDFFGTDGQNDPRGDFRNGQWSMTRVEGVDK